MASHIGKLPVTIPAGVEVKIDGQSFTAKGAKGTDSYEDSGRHHRSGRRQRDHPRSG